MKIGRLLAIDCLLVLVAGLPILRHSNLFERQYPNPTSAQFATAGVTEPLCSAQEPRQTSRSIIPLVYAQTCYVPPPCDFSLSPGGNISARVCDALTANKTNFAATFYPSLSQCPINPALSSCSFSANGNVYPDASQSSDNISNVAAACTAAYEAYPQVGTKVAGNYSFSMTIQWSAAYSTPTTHTVGGQVVCP
jgi:hypothetical protein